jgi:hypothetical protein
MTEFTGTSELKGIVDDKSNKVLIFRGESPCEGVPGFYLGDGDLLRNAKNLQIALAGVENKLIDVYHVFLSDRDLHQTIPIITKYKDYQLRILPNNLSMDALCCSTAYYARLMQVIHQLNDWTDSLNNQPHKFIDFWYLTKALSKKDNSKFVNYLNEKREYFQLEPIDTKFHYLDAVACFSTVFSPEQTVHWFNQMSFEDLKELDNYQYLEMNWIVKHPGANTPHLLSYLLEKAAIHYQKSIVLAKPYSAIVQKILKKGYIKETTKPTTIKGKGFGNYGNRTNQ